MIQLQITYVTELVMYTFSLEALICFDNDIEFVIENCQYHYCQKQLVHAKTRFYLCCTESRSNMIIYNQLMHRYFSKRAPLL